MNKKNKGISAERELLHIIWKKGWAAHRIAGSGSSRYPSPDIIAGNGGRILAIECKTSKAKNQYFSKEQINELDKFSKKFGAEPYLAVKFKETGWNLAKIQHLKETPKNFVLNEEMCKIYARKIEETFD